MHKLSNSCRTLKIFVELLSNAQTFKLFSFAITLFFIGSLSTKGQTSQKTLTLEEVIDLSRDQSLDALVARHQFLADYWEFRSFKAKYRPKLTLRSEFPQFSRAIKKYQKADGSYTYIEDNVNTTSLNLDMRQNIGYTGGQLFVSSDLQRIDEFGNIRDHNYMSTPISIGYRQPMLFYNEYKWEKKIEPLKFQEAKQKYLEALEEATIHGVHHFFNLLLAQKILEIARTNYANADTLFSISQERFKIGTIAENELMNMKLSLLNAETSMNEAKIDLRAAKIRLRSYLGFNESIAIDLSVPSDLPEISIDVTKAAALAKENNPEIINFERQMLQARQHVAQTKAEKGPNANLFASFGLTQKAEEFANAYQSPQNQQSLRVGLEIPLVDWGLGKGRYRMARSRQEVIKADIERSKKEFEQNVALDVMRFNLQDDQVRVKEQASITAQQRYKITRKRFLVGKVSVLELNDASAQQDQAKRNYIQSLRNYWQDYYEIRRMTLYDFLNQTKLTESFDALHE